MTIKRFQAMQLQKVNNSFDATHRRQRFRVSYVESDCVEQKLFIVVQIGLEYYLILKQCVSCLRKILESRFIQR